MKKDMNFSRLIAEEGLPQASDAEKALLSCLLQDPETAMMDDNKMISRLESEDYFYSKAHQVIFKALKALMDRKSPTTIDLFTVITYLEKTNELEDIGGADYLQYLLNIVPTSANVGYYLEQVLDSHILRSIIRLCSDTINRCYDHEQDADELLDNFEDNVLKLDKGHTQKKSEHVKTLTNDAVRYIEQLKERDASVVGLSTGYRDIDDKIGGLRAGELVVIAARPSVGKTALALNIACNIALRDSAACSIGIFSLEMSNTQVAVRMLCSEAKVNLRDIRDGRFPNFQWSKITGAADRLSKMAVYIDETAQLSMLELRRKARRMRHAHKINLIIIDYLQLMRPPTMNRNANREQEVARLSSNIKALAKDLNIPIMLLCQLNRQAEQGNRPRLYQLRESGAIEQDADLVILLHRDMDQQQNDDADKEGIETNVFIDKHRNGETGRVRLTFLPHYTRFENFLPEDEDMED